VIRVGVFGTAHVHVSAYVQNLAFNPHVDIVGVAEPDPHLRDSWSNDHTDPLFGSYAELIAAGIDAAVICTTTSGHRPLVEQLAEAGVAVLCEKPLATSVHDAAAIVQACQAADVPLMTAFPMRFSPDLASGASYISSGQIGDVIAFTGVNQGHIPTDYAAWFADPVEAGGGAIMDHTVHIVDILRWWTGAEPVEVFAEVNKIMHPGESVESAGIITVGFDNGVFATIDCSWSRPDGYPTWGGLAIEAVGSSGAFTIDAFANRLRMWSGGTESWVDWGTDANQAMIDHFVGAVRGKHALSVTGNDGLKATEVALAAYRSVQSGQPVTL
jgi:predicted dehydrogenase